MLVVEEVLGSVNLLLMVFGLEPVSSEKFNGWVFNGLRVPINKAVSNIASCGLQSDN